MNLSGLTKDWLVSHGFDGLCAPGECACGNDDLMPCGEPSAECQPGYKIPCPGPEDCDNDGHCDWHITTSKPVGKLLRVNVAARLLGVTDNHVRNLVRQGKLNYVRESPRKTFVLEDSLKAYQEKKEKDDG